MPAITPPERLVGSGVTLERAGPRHLNGLRRAVEVSHAELQKWMDWVGDELPTIEESRDHLDGRKELWDNGTEFAYAMTDPETGEVIGMTSLMTRQGPGRLEIGYWVRSDRAGTGVATAAAALLTAAGLDLRDVEIVEIHHDAANVASGRIPEKLGYSETARRAVESEKYAESGIEIVWEITRSERL